MEVTPFEGSILVEGFQPSTYTRSTSTGTSRTTSSGSARSINQPTALSTAPIQGDITLSEAVPLLVNYTYYKEEQVFRLLVNLTPAAKLLSIMQDLTLISEL